MMTWILDTGCLMLAHGWLLLGGVAVVATWRWMMRRRRARRPMVTIDLTGMHLSAAAVMYDQAAVDRIANQSLAAGMFIGAMVIIAGVVIAAVWVCRGSGNRPRNGRGAS